MRLAIGGNSLIFYRGYSGVSMINSYLVAVLTKRIGQSLTPESVRAPRYTHELSTGAQKFLSEAKKKDDELLNIAVELYESDSKAEMLDLCGIVLREIETLLYKNKHLTLPEFFCVCIIDMLSRAMELYSNSSSETAQVFHTTSSGITLQRNEALEVLFSLIRPTGPYDAFEVISKATGGKNYNRDRHGIHLVSYVETCLFKLKPRPRPPQDVDSLRMGDPPALGKPTPVAKTLPDRSSDSQSQRAESRAAGKQRTTLSHEIEEMDEDTDED